MKPLPLGLLLLLAAGTIAAQTTDPAAPRAVPNGRLPEAKRDRPAKYGKAILPDPDLLDGSSYEKEKRPLHGMISEIEMGENEGGRQDKVSPNSGPAGGGQPAEDKPNSGALAANQPKEQPAGGAEAEKIPEGQAAPAAAGPEAKADGIQVANLKVPEGAAGADDRSGAAKPREQQIGDATLQIQTIKQNAPNVVGAQQASTNQQFEKKVPSGASSIPSQGNVGVEKGRVVPKGL